MTSDMPSGVLFLSHADRETLDGSVFRGRQTTYGGQPRGREGTPMQELRFVAVSEDGSYAVLAVPGRSARFTLPIDERLRAVALGQTSRLAQYEIEVESPLRPKEIQARIRAGETAEEIADAAGIPVERVRWFEGPVLAERAYIADQAQAASVRRAGDSGGPGARLGDIVPERITASGADARGRAVGLPQARRRQLAGHAHVPVRRPAARRRVGLRSAPPPRHARRRQRRAAVAARVRAAARAGALPGEATVTPLAPRLGAAAGMGGGGMGGGGFAGGGSGVGVRSFRPERSVIPDRSLGGDRSLADRPLSPPRPRFTLRPGFSRFGVASAADRPGMPERPAMSHRAGGAPGSAPAGLPRPHRLPRCRPRAGRPPRSGPDGLPRAAPEQRAPEQRAPEQPAPAGTVPVTAPPYVFEDLPSPAGDRAGHTPSRHVVFEEPEPGLPRRATRTRAAASSGSRAHVSQPGDARQRGTGGGPGPRIRPERPGGAADATARTPPSPPGTSPRRSPPSRRQSPSHPRLRRRRHRARRRLPPTRPPGRPTAMRPRRRRSARLLRPPRQRRPPSRPSRRPPSTACGDRLVGRPLVRPTAAGSPAVARHTAPSVPAPSVPAAPAPAAPTPAAARNAVSPSRPDRLYEPVGETGRQLR